MNLLIFIVFILVKQDAMGLPHSILVEYAADTTIAIILVGVVSYQIFSITDNALKKAETDLQQKELAEKQALSARSFMARQFYQLSDGNYTG